MRSARRFRTVEINNTFYRLPTLASFAAWRDQVPADFRFACKASRYITHMKKLKDPAASGARFFDAVAVLGDRLGPILFQLPPRWRSDPGRLRAGQNVEAKLRGGYRRCEGYTAFDSNAVPGSGAILGVNYYNGKAYAFRNAADGLTAAMYSSAGSGWTLEKSALSPGGRYRFVNEAFAGTLKMYGASGVHTHCDVG